MQNWNLGTKIIWVKNLRPHCILSTSWYWAHLRSLMSVADNANQRYHVEHINSVSHMMEKIAVDGSGGPMNSISNMMLLEHSINIAKGNTTVKEYLADNELEDGVEQQIREWLISDLEYTRSRCLHESDYRTYCNQRWQIIKLNILRPWTLVRNLRLKRSAHSGIGKDLTNE